METPPDEDWEFVWVPLHAWAEIRSSPKIPLSISRFVIGPVISRDSLLIVLYFGHTVGSQGARSQGLGPIWAHIGPIWAAIGHNMTFLAALENGPGDTFYSESVACGLSRWHANWVPRPPCRPNSWTPICGPYGAHMRPIWGPI